MVGCIPEYQSRHRLAIPSRGKGRPQGFPCLSGMRRNYVNSALSLLAIPKKTELLKKKKKKAKGIFGMQAPPGDR